MSQKVYQIITDRILAMLERGVVPWHQPWKTPSSDPSDSPFPKNFITKKEYRGINVFLLSSAGYSSSYWMTFKQAQSLNGRIKKGEKSHIVIFWTWLDSKKDKYGIEEIYDKKIPCLRFYHVFNLEQTEGIEYPKEVMPHNWNPIDRCEEVIKNMSNPPIISYGVDHACYYPSSDTIRMPNKELFKNQEGYYSTVFHELVHSTGHQSRLNRPTIVDICPFGTTNYSREELIAEMGAAFLCAYTGIENKTIDNSASYIAGWLQTFQNDKKLIILASGQAQKAVDYLLGKNGSPEEEE